jgi:phytol kinase
MIQNPWIAAVITMIICLIWMRINNFIAKKNLISSSTSRKIVHIGTGPVFLLCWLLFPDHPLSKYLAAIVPFLIVLQLAMVGLGFMKDDSSVKAMARTGSKSELLRGPFYYGIIFVLLTVLFWKTPYSIIPLMILCGGDGMADLIGSRFGQRQIPWNKNKTLIGSIAMFICGFALSILLILPFVSFGIIDPPLSKYLIPIILISLIGTLIESLTPSEYDNISVPAVSLILSLILL